MIKKILTGCKCIDNTECGAVLPGNITLFYGEPETGKTTLAMQCAIDCSMQDYKTLFMDGDKTFSIQRLAQISSGNLMEISELITLVRPKDFKEQTMIIDQLPDYGINRLGLIVIDTVNSLYSVSIAERPGDTFRLNRDLNRQMALLAQIAKTQKISVLVTSQVRSVLNETYVNIEPVAKRVLKFWADNIIALKHTLNPQIIDAVFEKNAKRMKGAHYLLRIEGNGIHDYQHHS